MIPFFSRLWSRSKRATLSDDTGYFVTRQSDYGDDTRLYVRWRSRMEDLRAQPYDEALGLLLLIKLFGQDGPLARLGAHELARLGGHLEYVQVERGCKILGQDEQGDYMLIVLQGMVAEDRLLPAGERVRLGEAQPGDLLGELCVLDGGSHYCACHALSPVTLAVLSAPTLARITADEPALAAALATWLARRVSLRLRQINARLSVHLTKTTAH